VSFPICSLENTDPRVGDAADAPLGARATIFSTDRPDGSEVRDVHDTSAGRSPRSPGQTPTHDRSLPHRPRPSATPPVSNVRPSDVPSNIRLTLFPLPRSIKRSRQHRCHRARASAARRGQGETHADAIHRAAPSRAASRPLDRDTRRQHPVASSQVAPKKPSTLREHSFARVRPGQSRVAARSFSPPKHIWKITALTFPFSPSPPRADAEPPR
jgi:hypothetical protein